MATKTVTARNQAQIDTAQYKIGSASGLFDGSGDYLDTPDDADWNFGSGDFTIEWWARFAGVQDCGIGQYVDANNQMYFLEYGAVTKLIAFAKSGGTTIFDYEVSWNPTLNTWYHIAFVRYGNTFAIYIDGTAKSLTENTTISGKTLPDLASILYINPNYGTGCHNGWIDELRVSKGIARYTGNFTPSTDPFAADQYTVLLLHCEGADASTTFTDDSYSVVDLSLTLPTATINLSAPVLGITKLLSLILPTAIINMLASNIIATIKQWKNQAKHSATNITNQTKHTITPKGQTKNSATNIKNQEKN